MYTYIFAFLIAICTPCDITNVQIHALEQIKDKTGYLFEQSRQLIEKSVKFNAFPSNHCLDQFNLMFGVVLFNFFDKTNKKDSNKIITCKII